ncbi:queuine tRNA-ribosyltransferase tRNA-guanine transglycosylase [Haladaptatus sp. CMSO5]|uniref:queuine tRNA-ribosyltransferase tRNA-guanine transglycosylase n=1 Tax=Haladaptatus sp. CMSO5 TaxID=3120514 RepID=UPI002FCE1B26
MRFYVPEWDDAVDADYDFVHDEHSEIDRSERELSYIWDIFDYDTTPIDGVLISREQVEESDTKFARLTKFGVYNDPVLNIPEWLPTISDCGAWGYKSLPFPPYGNKEMLDFYETLEVTTGVTIDHLILGSEHKDRLYLNKTALGENVRKGDLPDELTEDIEVMVDEWPEKWPPYVKDEEPSIYDQSSVEQFEDGAFEGSKREVLSRLRDDPRAVYREDDMQYRFDLTMRNAEEMKRHYDAGDYPFRLMVAIQGWDPQSYGVSATHALELGYNYLGIGGVAGSPASAVKRITAEVGNIIKAHERKHNTRIDTHVFGFAKTDAFDAVGTTGMTSFDSASMLRAAWTGGDNYHIDDQRRYDAIRVRFGSNRDSLSEAIEKALRGQELLWSLRAYGKQESIGDAIKEWHEIAVAALEGLPSYIREKRHDDGYDVDYVREVEEFCRDDYQYGRALRANFSRKFRRKLVKLFRDDHPDDPIPLETYDELVQVAKNVFEGNFPRMLKQVRERESNDDEVGAFGQIWPLVEDYANWIGDDGYLQEYEATLRSRPWDECDCPICEEHGIEVAIFRANNRNRRRGFHNTHRFYQQFDNALPKTLVVTPVSANMIGNGTVENALQTHRGDFWSAVHDLPISEIGAISANGFHEWWEETPPVVSLDPDKLVKSLSEKCSRYENLHVYCPDGRVPGTLQATVEDGGCSVAIHDSPTELRAAVLDSFGYPSDYVPDCHVQKGLMEF